MTQSEIDQNARQFRLAHFDWVFLNSLPNASGSEATLRHHVPWVRENAQRRVIALQTAYWRLASEF
jgi:hypothetical protein